MKVVKKSTCWYNNNNNNKRICSYVKIKKSMVYNKKIKLFLTGLVVKYTKNNLRKRRTKEVAH